MKYQAIYTDSNNASNTHTLTAKSLQGAKRQATHAAPAMTNILLIQDDYPAARRLSWQNPNGNFGLHPWEPYNN